ncbi:hypothetical protein FEM48_Zijuj01G0100500 [Ziziphus jujuba var. spinosa]|uniref:Rx N-terminal domain-containing protein n=1 Tax=Ziziphus jujuba var. spinosa TaxID=714518 RepID=A0A978W0L6_ZIZJJ|nr:hypothetical protein FEM48_Zijuj01G0100500 [Ziziphus jujuba var. spinosa]
MPWYCSVKKDVAGLKSKLEAVHGVLEEAEKKQLIDGGVNRWLDELKEVSYDMDNVLDKWSTEILKSKIVKQAEGENSVVSGQKRLDFSLEKAKALPNNRRETTSFVDESQVYGRDGDKSFVISKLLCESTLEGSGMMFFQQKSPPLKCLRTLNLRGCRIKKLPQQLGQLIQLRYLNLCDNPELTELPNEVCDICNLEILRLEECYRLQRLPEGMGKLVSCSPCETLPPLGSLPSLEVLAISQMYNVRKIGSEFWGNTNTNDMVTKEEDQVMVSFPKLKQLRIYFLREWEEWEGDETTNIVVLLIMPWLDFLEIYHYKSLKSPPEFLKGTPMKTLTIDCCDILLQSFQ